MPFKKACNFLMAECNLLQAPQKVYLGHHLESTRWDLVKPRASDIVISTAYKSGTTWTQAILANLIFKDEKNFPRPPLEMFHWVDMRIPPIESLNELEEQTHRRVLKSHLPATALPIYKEIKYVVVGRDPRDVFMSLYNHWGSFTSSVMEKFNSFPEQKLPPLPEDLNKTFEDWITKGSFPWEEDGYPFWSFFYHIQTWWELRHLPNVYFLHYADLKRDISGEIRKLADFCEIEIVEEDLQTICSNVSFEHMKANSSTYLGEGVNRVFQEGGNSFLHKGVNGRWRDNLDEKSLEVFNKVLHKFPADLIDWVCR